MCIIIACPPKVELPRYTLQNAWDANPDGGGFMYVANNKIKIVKELSNFDRFYKLYKKHVNKAFTNISPMIVHFRIGTHGERTLKNTHPFIVNEDIAFCHNGIIDIKPANANSDTVQFNFDYLRKLPSNFLDNEIIMKLLEDFVGTNKLVFLSTSREVHYLNKNLGFSDEETGIWYSNKSYTGAYYTSAKAKYKPGIEWKWDDVAGEGYVDSFSPTVSDQKLLIASSSECDFCDKSLSGNNYTSIEGGGVVCESCSEQLLGWAMGE